jgi:hypothetical protein
MSHTQHVKGHQEGPNLDRLATLNCEMDQSCKKYWETTKDKAASGLIDHWFAKIGEREVFSNLMMEITEYCAMQLGASYWEKKLVVDQIEIDWTTTARAMKETTRKKQQWIVKHSSGFCGVGIMMHRTKQWATTRCPRCGDLETAEHVWKCQHADANVLWDKAMEDLVQWFRQQGTMPDIIVAVISGLNGWRNNSQEGGDLEDKDVILAFTKQSQAGWKHFFEGRPCYQWAQIQSTYFRDALQSYQSGKRWLIELIKKMWNIAWDLWEHRNGILHDGEAQAHNSRAQ